MIPHQDPNRETVIINGREFIRTYSDTYTIQRDGVEYDEAVDPVESGRIYTETENLLIVESPPDPEPEEPVEDVDATEVDYIDALNDLGVKFNEEI